MRGNKASIGLLALLGLVLPLMLGCASGDPTKAGAYSDSGGDSTAQKFYLDNGMPAWRIECRNSMSPCYARANLLCPKGFISEEAGVVSAQSGGGSLIYNPYLGGYQAFGGGSSMTLALLAVCTEGSRGEP